MYEEEREYAERPNKTAIKRELLKVESLAKQLLDCTPAKLDKLPLPDHIRSAIDDGQGFKKGALKRQLGFLKGKLADEDYEGIQQALIQLDQPAAEDIAREHQLERWREGLLANQQDIMDEISAAIPAIDWQHLRQLIRNANKEKQQNKPPKSARLLFQYLKQEWQDS